MNLETITGDLRAYRGLEPGTFQHVDQLMNARRDDVALRNEWFYTADGQGYFPQGEDVEWAITRLPNNLVLRHLDEAFLELRTIAGNYHPDNAEALAAKTAADTLVTPLSRLRLFGYDSEEPWYLSIRTDDGFIRIKNNYQAPNEDEQKVMNRLRYTLENLRMLHDSPQKIRETRVYVFNPAYVLQEVGKDLEKNSLWRASWLYNFNNNSNFIAGGCCIGDSLNLRGVRLVE